MREPAITVTVTGGNTVSISDVNTIDELAAVTRKFARLIDAEAAPTICHLATCVGDLSASVLSQKGSDEDFAEEVADVLIATMVVAANRSLEGFQIREAIVCRLTQQSDDAVNSTVRKALEVVGLVERQVINHP